MSGKAKRRIAKTVFLIIISVAVFSAIIFSLYKIDFMGAFEIFPSLFGNKDDNTPQNNSEKINDILGLLGEDKTDYELVDTDAVTLIAMLTSSEPDDSYYHAYNVRIRDGDNVNAKSVRVQKRADSWSVHVLENDAVVKTVNFDGDEYSVRDDVTGETRTFSKNSGLSFDGQTYLTPVSEIITLLTEYEKSADGSAARISDCEISLARSQSANLVSLRFKYNSTGQIEEYVIDLDRLVVLSATSSVGETVYYEASTITFDPELK